MNKWPLFEENEGSVENDDKSDEIRELEGIEDEEEQDIDSYEAARKLEILTKNCEWVSSITANDDKIVLVVKRGAPDSEELPYEIDGVPIDVDFIGED